MYVDDTLAGTVQYVNRQTVYEFRDVNTRGSVVTLIGGDARDSFISIAELEVYTKGKILQPNPLLRYPMKQNDGNAIFWSMENLLSLIFIYL